MKTLVYCRAFVLILMLGCSPLLAEVLIKDVQIINKEGHISKQMHVHIKNGLIQAIGQEAPTANSVEIIDGKGRYLIPGLIDSHVHLNGIPGESDAMPQKVREQAAAQIPKSYLYFGFTTVLDLFSGDGVIDAWNNRPLAPTAYYCAGTPIPGGYPLAWLPKDIQLGHPAAETYLFDPRQKTLMASTAGSELHKTKPLVAGIAKTSARCIKAYFERGFGDKKGLPVPTLAMLRELVDEAKKYDLPVYVHGTSIEAHQLAIAAGAQLMAHGVWSGENAGEQLAITSLAKRTAKQGIAVQPTMQVINGEMALLHPDFFRQQAVQHVMPKSLMDWYQSEDGQWFRRVMTENINKQFKTQDPAQARGKMKWALDNVQAHTRALFEAGAALQFGSDTPSGPIYTQFPGLNGREEMTRWVESGVSLLELYKALTYRNAKLLRLEKLIGSVEVGKQADLLLLRKNPLESLAAYDAIEKVILKGQVLARESLSAEGR